MTPHQEHRLRLLTERGTVAFSREENLRKLAVECLELALVIEHHLEGKRDLFDIALEGADVAIMLARVAGGLPCGSGVSSEDWSMNMVTAVFAIQAGNMVVVGAVNFAALTDALTRLRAFVGDQNWSSALDVKLSKAERYITDREQGNITANACNGGIANLSERVSLLARPAGGLE